VWCYRTGVSEVEDVVLTSSDRVNGETTAVEASELGEEAMRE